MLVIGGPATSELLLLISLAWSLVDPMLTTLAQMVRSLSPLGCHHTLTTRHSPLPPASPSLTWHLRSMCNLWPQQPRAMLPSKLLKPRTLSFVQMFSIVGSSSQLRNKISFPLFPKSAAGCHELAFFTFFLLLFYCIDTCCYSPRSCSKHKLTPFNYPFRLLTLFQTIKKIKRVYYGRADGPLQGKTKRQVYLMVRKNYRTSDPL